MNRFLWFTLVAFATRVVLVYASFEVDYFDKLRLQSKNNVSFETRQDSAVVLLLVNSSTTSMRMGQITSLLPITTRIHNESGTFITPRSINIQNEAAALLAVHDFNNRNSTVMTLPQELQRCNLYMTLELRDSQLNPMESSRQFFEALQLSNNNDHSSDEMLLQNPRPMGIMGAIRSSVSAPVSILSGVYEIPQVSPTSTSSQLENREISPYFARTISTNAGDAKALVYYLHQNLGVQAFGVAYARGPYGSEFYSDLSREAKAWNMTAEGVPYEEDDSITTRNSSMEAFMGRLQSLKLNYFVGIFFDSTYALFLEQLYDVGLIGNPEKVWFFTDSMAFVAQPGYTPPSNKVALALHGSGVLYLKVTRNPNLDQGVGEFMSLYHDYYISRHAEQDIFDSFDLNDLPKQTSAFNTMVYDAIMLLCLAACAVPKQFFTGKELYQQMLTTTFRGALGPVELTKTGSRNPSTLSFQIINLILMEQQDVVLKKQPSILLQTNGTTTVLEPFVYFGNNPPAAFEVTNQDLNLVPLGLRIMGWTLAGIVIMLSIFFGSWSVVQRNRPVVRASQPVFLCMISIGTLVMATTIIPLSFQEPMSQPTLDRACMSAPWLFSVGWVTSFSALFSKAYRITKLYQHSQALRRVEIRAKHVLLPFVLLMTLNVTILTTWTIVDPLQWVRTPVSSSSVDRFGNSTESYGSCHAPNYLAYLISIVVINACALLFALVQTFQSRNLPLTNYKESQYIAISFCSLLEAFVLAIPIMVVVQDNPSADFLLTAILVTVVCCAILLPIFIPKFLKRNESIQESVGRRSVELYGGAAGGSSTRAQQLGVFPTSRWRSSNIPTNSSTNGYRNGQPKSD